MDGRWPTASTTCIWHLSQSIIGAGGSFIKRLLLRFTSYWLRWLRNFDFHKHGQNKCPITMRKIMFFYFKLLRGVTLIGPASLKPPDSDKSGFLKMPTSFDSNDRISHSPQPSLTMYATGSESNLDRHSLLLGICTVTSFQSQPRVRSPPRVLDRPPTSSLMGGRMEPRIRSLVSCY